jgi:23S rRNA (guanosine2251-2'-O)-methyltransferase
MGEKLLVGGRQPVLEALRAGTEISRLFLQKGTHGVIVEEILRLARQYGIPVEFKDKQALWRMSSTPNHQGVLAETVSFSYIPFHQLLEQQDNRPAFLLVLDHLQDPHNLGALMRTAHAAGCQGLVIAERRAAQVTPAVVRTACGATLYLPVARVVNVARCLEECREAGWWIYGADMAGETLYTDADYRGNTVLVLGSEGKGLSRLVKEKCDLLLKVPMKGQLASLNVSVAGALLLYEALRQREQRL